MLRRPIVDRMSLALGRGLSWLFFLAVLLTVVEVVMRYVFSEPTIWVHDVVTVLSATCFVIGGVYATQQRNHIQMATYTEKVAPRMRRVLDLICHILAAAYLLMFVVGAWRQAWPAIELIETSGRAWDVPIPMFLKTMLLVGAVLMLIQTISHILHRVPNSPETSETVL